MPKYSGFDPIQSHNVVTTSSSTGSISHANTVLTTLYLPFNDDVNDDSPFSQTITNRGSMTVDSTYAKFGSKSLKSETSGSLKIDNSSDTDLDGSFTLEFFLYLDTYENSRAVYVHNEITSSYSGLLFWTANAGGQPTLQAYASTNGSSWNLFNGNTISFGTISTDAWHHVAITYDGSTYRGYYNGNRKWEVTSSTTLPTGGHHYIFSRNNAGQYRPTTGSFYMDDFRITKGKALYTDATYTVPTSALGIEQDHPVSLYLPFDSDVQDASAKNYTVTAVNSAAISSTQAKFGGNSLSLNGTNQYLTIPDSQDFAFGSVNFTVEMWVYPTTLQQSGLYSQWGSGSNRSFKITMDSNGNILVNGSYNGTSGSHLSISSSEQLIVNNWYHIAAVCIDGTVTLYINGVKNGSGDINGTFYNSTNDVAIGANIAGVSSNLFAGYIDDVRVIKGFARYTRNFIPPSQAVGATVVGANVTNTTTDFTSLYLPFDSDIQDDSSHNHSFTAAGNAAISSTQAKFGSNSLFIDAAGDYISAPSNTMYGHPFRFGTSDFTIEMFIRPDDTNTSDQVSNLACIIDHDADAGTSNSWFALHHNGRRLVFGSNNVALVTSDLCIDAGTWHHVAVVRSSGTTTIYCDGVNVGSAADTNNYDDSGSRNLYIGKQNVTFGGSNAGGTRRYDGYIDDLRILKGHAKYTAEFVPPTTPATTSVSETVNDLVKLYMPFNADVTSSTGGLKWNTSHNSGRYSFQHDGYSVSKSQSGWGVVAITEGSFYTGKVSVDIKALSIDGGETIRANFGIFRKQVIDSEIGYNKWISQPWDGDTSKSAGVQISSSTVNDIYTLNIDFDNGTLQLKRNDTQIGTDTFTIGGEFNIAYQEYYNTSRYQIVDQVYDPPTGYTKLTTTSGVTTTTATGGYEDQARNNTITDTDSVSYGDVTISPLVKKFGTSSAFFDGRNDSLVVEDTATKFKFEGDFTIEVQVYPTATTQDAVLGYHGSSGTSGWILQTGYNGSGGSTGGRFYTNSGALILNTSAINTNEWSHVAITRSGSTVRLFVNGSLEDSATFTDKLGGTGSTQDLRIGASTSHGTQPFEGYIDDLRIIDGHARYTAAFTPPSSAVGLELSETTTNVNSDTKVLSSTWTMTNDGSSPRSFIDMRSDNTWANNEHLQSQSSHRWNPANAGGAPNTVATGGTIATPGNGYRYHVFTSPGTFELTSIDGGAPTLAVEYLIVAGGGGGGADRAGGAGGGGFKTNEDGNPLAAAAMNLSTGTTNVVVGAGGAGADAPQTPAPYQNPSPLAYAYNGRQGYASSFGSIESRGGGGGGGPQSPNPEGPGGSGGGGGSNPGQLSGYAGNIPPATPIPQGNPGANGAHTNYGGGGGGAGAAGSFANAGNGHAAPSFSGPILAPVIPGAMATAIGPTGIYAGGGGGGAGEGTPTGAGNAGTGGGGAGGARSIPPSSYNPNSNEYGPAGAPGVDGTGGGGGGAGNFPGTNTNMRPGGDGGDGIVIIKYPY